jgi:acyl-CoA dehydrogenase
MPYRSPVSEIVFLLRKIVGFDQVAATGRFAEATPDMVDAILTESASLCDNVLAPLNRAGDEHPARLENGSVVTSPGFAEGYRAIASGGWIGMSASAAAGGLGLPMTLTSAVNDMMSGACLALQLNPMLTQGQIEALEAHASLEMKALYLPRLISGAWSGTMNLTEPQAGSDVGALRTKAVPNGDGTYAITGEKIYISWADSDFAANICHLVLARLPDAAPGTRGISLFMVPKFLPDPQGNPGPRNTLRVQSLEHKLGLHGSPTAVMAFEGATGWLVGAPHAGMAAMFTMMNNARLGVGIQGIGVAEAAMQAAMDHALARRQGRAGGTGSIAEHADVRRMLALMRAEVFAARAIALSCAVATDMATATGAPDWKARAALLTPIAKAHGTEIGLEVANIGIQVHGGAGFIEATGAAQFARDVRVTSIYEGTNGIQAMDLVGRKLSDGGAAALALIDEVEKAAEAAMADHAALALPVGKAAQALRATTRWLLTQEPQDRNAGAVPYLRAFARTLGAAAHLRAATSGDRSRAGLAAFFIQRILPEQTALLAQVEAGAEALMVLSPADLAGDPAVAARG